MKRLEDKQRKMRDRWAGAVLRNPMEPCECAEVVRLREAVAHLREQVKDISSIVIDCLLEMEFEQHQKSIKRYRARKKEEGR